MAFHITGVVWCLCAPNSNGVKRKIVFNVQVVPVKKTFLVSERNKKLIVLKIKIYF